MSTEPKPRRADAGPFRIDQLHPGDRYELSRGHAFYCAATGADGARRVGTGFAVLDTDPTVTEAGIDAGYALDAGTLRAPNIAIGHVPDRPGWVTDGVPPLAVEYAGIGQDEATLGTKIDELLARGTRFIWVIRLTEPRHVEVHEPGRLVRIEGLDGTLEAPSVLQNPVPVRAFFDRDVAHQQVLDNLVQRRGHASYDAALRASFEQGRRVTAERQLARRFGPLPDWARARLASAATTELDAILDALLDAPTLEAVFTEALP